MPLPSPALRLSALAVATALALAGNACAADADAGDDTLEEITVTGTRLRRVDQEDLQPLLVITRDQLDASGQTSVAAVLRNLPQSSFGPTTDRLPNGLPGSTTPNLRGAGAAYTLVLLDGVPLVGEPSQAGGDVQNLNVLPWAAVDRIEIVSDGASAIYGSKAIGGVINVVTRRDFDGGAASLQVDRATRGGAGTNTGSVVAGFRSGASRGLVSVEISDSDPLFAHDRDFLPPQFSFDAAPPTYRRNDPTGTTDVAWHPAANCPATLGSDPRYPNSQLGPVLGDGSQFCTYDFVADAQEIAALERRSLLASGSTNLGDGLAAHALVLVTRNRARGEIAAASSSTIPEAIGADNPINPTRGEVAPGVGYALDLRYRPVPAGHRIITTHDDVEQVAAGIAGRSLFGWNADWSVDVAGARYTQDTTGRNFARYSLFLDAIADGRFNPFADPATQDYSTFMTSIRNRASHRTQGVTAQVQPSSFEVAGVAFDALAGVEYDHESFAQHDDAAAIDGDVFGAIGTNAAGRRDYRAAFGEVVANQGGRWELKGALRRDDYSDAGGATSPKLAASFKPIDALLLRASAGKGFHVPDLVTLGGALSSFTQALADPLGCALRPNDPLACGNLPREVFFLPNPQLGPETARQASVGAIWSPTQAFSVGVQGYQTKVRDVIASLDQYLVLDNDVACHAAGRSCDTYKEGRVERDANGEIMRILVPLSVNAASSTTRGYDVDVRGSHATEAGTFDARLVYSRTTHFEQAFPGGTISAPLGYFGYPHYRATLELNWRRGAWRATLAAHAIGPQRNCDVYDAGTETCAQDVPRYATLDAQVGWQVAQRTSLSLGARNLTDRRPYIDYTSSYGRNLYDAIGRVVYLRAEQRF